MADIKKFQELCKLTYKEQAIRFMNGFWGSKVTPQNASKYWDWVQYFIKLDKMSNDAKGADGNELDQFWSAKFLEDQDTALTATARKEALRDIDQDNNGKMSALEYFMWKNKVSVEAVCNIPEGTMTDADRIELEELQASMKRLQAALEDLKAKQAELKKLQEEQRAAIAEMERQEAAYKAQCSSLKDLAENGTGLKKSKAAVELAALLSEDPLPLRRAKITMEAAIRKVEKQQKAVAEQQDQVVAEMDACRVKIDALKAKGSIAAGELWWMEREMFDADERLARARQKYDHSKPFFFDPHQK